MPPAGTVPVSILVITRNEEANIAECLASAAWAREIVVVDAESTDRTVELARASNAKVFVEPWRGYAGAKQFALDRCSEPWVLWLDADERVTPELAEEIATAVVKDEPLAAYRMGRRAYFLGKWIRHCGWYPAPVARLFRRDRARFGEERVHESLRVDGPIGRLRSDLLHFTDRTLDGYFEKFNRYTTLAAEDLASRGERASMSDLLLRAPFTFFRMYVLQLGVLDGYHGFLVSALSAAYVLVKYAKLRELARRRT
jgi:glycosyltransferase involved in cell wall biosynthesis